MPSPRTRLAAQRHAGGDDGSLASRAGRVLATAAKELSCLAIALVIGIAPSPEGFAASRASANHLGDSNLGESAAESAPTRGGAAGAARGARVGFDGSAPPPSSYTELSLVVETEGRAAGSPLELSIRFEAEDLASPDLVRSEEGVTLRRGGPGEVLLSLGELRGAGPFVAAATGLPPEAPLFCDPSGDGESLAVIEFQVLRPEPLDEADLPIELRLRASPVTEGTLARACLALAALSTRFYVPTAFPSSLHRGSE